MSLALLFPGQGTQHPEMLRWVDDDPAAAATLARLAQDIGSGWRAHLADADWACSHAVAQSLLTGLSLAAWDCLAPRLPAPAVVAGYSVGELPAFCAAGVFDTATAMQLARARAGAMAQAMSGLDGGLLAVQGPSAAALAQACTRHGLDLAIRLGPDRAVLGGPDASLRAAQSALQAAGAQCTRLAVQVASHTHWMADAALAFARQLGSLPFAPPRATLVCNLGAATPRSPAALKHALAGQIAATVPWDACQDAIAERRVRCVLEVGPGSTLSRLWNEREPAVPARSIDEFRSADAAARWVHGVLG